MTGRTCKYGTCIEPHLDLILGWLRAGYTEESIGKRLGVGVSSWCKYKREIPQFAQLIQKGQQDLGALSLNHLYKRAMGYNLLETTKERNESGKLVVTKTVTKHVPPDVGANIFIICNRIREWQSVQHIQHSGELMSALSDEDCQKIRGMLKANHEQNGNSNGNGDTNHDHSGPDANGNEPAQQ